MFPENMTMDRFNWWPLLVFVPGLILYAWFKVTSPNLLGDWSALFKDGLASGAAFLGVGATLFAVYEDWLHWLGLALMIWSLTYWGSALISRQNLRIEARGGKINSAFTGGSKVQPAPNRRQRRNGRKR